MHGLPIHETNRIIREQRAGDHPREGLDRCTCGAKYWDGDICHSCGAQWAAVRPFDPTQQVFS